jgi:hypothetical protein
MVLRDAFEGLSLDNESKERRYQYHLLALADKHRLPLYAYDVISHHVHVAALHGVDLTEPPLRRNALIKQASNQLSLDALRPSQVPVILKGGGTINVTTFDFPSLVTHLLSDHRLCDDLLINWRDPSQPPNIVNQDTHYSEVLTGDWYKRTHRKMITKSDQLLAGLILGMDRSHVQSGSTQRLSLEPVYFTLPIIPLHHRRQRYGWRILGYVNNLNLEPSSLHSARPQFEETSQKPPSSL